MIARPMPTFLRSLELPHAAEEVYAWHVRPGAFERLRPPWQNLEVVQPAAVEPGSRLVFRLRRGPVALRWVAEHRDVVPGRGFTDVQIEGPFARWRHRHLVEPRPGGCELRDEIEYRLPAGVLGQALAGSAVERDLERLFAYRHRVTAEDLALHARHPRRLRVAVAGAGGLLGSAFCALLTTGGHQVLRLVRREPASAEEVAWDPARGVLDPGRLEDLDALVYLAGENVGDGRWTPERKRRLARSRIEAVMRLVASLEPLAASPKVFACASGVSFYGDGDEPRAENAPPGEGFLAELSARWEEAAETATAAWGARVARLRLGVVLSARGGALARLLPPWRLGLGVVPGSGSQFLSWISLDDAVGAILHVLAEDALSGAVNLTAPGPVTQGDLARTLSRLLRRPLRVPVPAAALRAVYGEMAEETVLASVRALPERLEASGYRFRHRQVEDALRHGLGLASASAERTS